MDGSRRWLSLGAGSFDPAGRTPEQLSAATSCWIRPQGLFYALGFPEDRGDDPAAQGWNVDVELDLFGGRCTVPYRGRSTRFAGSLESLWGTELARSDDAPGERAPFVVRFQGARAAREGERFCATQLDGSGGTVVEGSVTPWVIHPGELGSFDPPPDMVRFTVVFDPSARPKGTPGVSFIGLTGLWIAAAPE